jgi:hypothetical protein
MERVMEEVTPRALFDLYRLLSDDGKASFVRLLAAESTAEFPFWITANLPLEEQFHYAGMMHDQLLTFLFPPLIAEARKLAKEKPSLSDPEFDRELDKRANAAMAVLLREMSIIERIHLKKQRDRPSGPETIRRNVEICDLRRQDRKKWSLVRLAKKYGISVRVVTKTLKHEAEWRRKAAQPRPN